MNNTGLKQGQIIQVKGWIMLKGLDEGIYKVLNQDQYSYTFAKHKGKKAICRHYKKDVDGRINLNDQESNCIIILN